ncbi:MAG: DUF5719 family protein [Actinobacteria bacterium]|nr:DUF5719 family protein [Actinomycetota bacterium]
MTLMLSIASAASTQGSSRHTTQANATGNSGDGSIWYLAEGSTAWGFVCIIAIENPNADAVTLKITFMTDSGPVTLGNVVLPAESQGFLDPESELGERDFSTKVECLEGEHIAVDRTMLWIGDETTGALEGHSSIGVTSPDTTWYLPEGTSNWGFECWLLIQNPNDSEATCNVTYMMEGGGPKTFTKKVPANSRKTFNMADDIGAREASIKVESDLPVIPERAMYRNNRREGHDSIGTTSPANDYYLAEGTTAYGFTTYVLVQNPNPTPANVQLVYMTPGGPVYPPAFSMPANSRETVRVNDYLPNTDLSTQVHADQPIIAERAMYWDNGTGEACHDSIGMDLPHMKFYLPDGAAGEEDEFETWTLVQNPNDDYVTVRVSYLPNVVDGGQKIQFTDTIPPNSRKTYNMADTIRDGEAGIMVESLTTGKKIMVERSMYWYGKEGGTNTIGGYSD